VAIGIATLLLMGGFLPLSMAVVALPYRFALGKYASSQRTAKPDFPNMARVRVQAPPTAAVTGREGAAKAGTGSPLDTRSRISNLSTPVPRQSSVLRPAAPVPVSQPLWQVSTLAGPHVRSGIGPEVGFQFPTGVAVDAAGTVYVADQENNAIRKISPDGLVTTLAGGVSEGAADGVGLEASFSKPAGLAVDAQGTVYVADQNNHKIRKITADGVVTTLAGRGIGAANGVGASASFNYPAAVAIDAQGAVFVADRFNHQIRRITAGGVVSTLAGSGRRGDLDGPGRVARFSYPTGIAVDASGIVYVADQENHRIRRITSSGIVSTLAGWNIGAADGAGPEASFRYPSAVALDAATGNLLVADQSNHKIRVVNPDGVVATLAGRGSIGASDGEGSLARFFRPSGVAVDAQGTIYVADRHNHHIRKITRLLTS
jgi:sugar lactone lactonase YvrE